MENLLRLRSQEELLLLLYSQHLASQYPEPGESFGDSRGGAIKE
jgi:hypothetical protein